MTVSDLHAICTGFESNTVQEFQQQNGISIISASPTPKTGTYCLKIDTTTAVNSTWQHINPEPPAPTYLPLAYSWKIDVQVSGAPTKQCIPWFQLGEWTLVYETSGKLTLKSSSDSATGTTVLTTNTWVRLEVAAVANDRIYLRINGVDEVSISNTNGAGTMMVSGGVDNSIKGGTGYGFYTYVDNMIVLYTQTAGIQTPWIGAATVSNYQAQAEGNYADSTVTGVAHPNAYQNIDDYYNTADYNTLGSNSVVKRDTYKGSSTITLGGGNSFLGFSAIALLRANNSPSAVAPMLIRDNAVDISDGRAAVRTELVKGRGWYKWRPSDNTVSLTKAMLDTPGTTGIEWGLYVPVQSGGTMTYDIYSAWVSYFEGAAMTDITPVLPKQKARIVRQAVNRAGTY